jgi:hypothetical protein
MNEKDHFKIQIPTALAKKIKKRIEGTDFPSISSYAIYIIGGKFKPSFLSLKTSYKDLNMTNSPLYIQYILCHSSLDYLNVLNS